MQKKILIIDDDLLILYGLQKALRHEGVEINTASTAAFAEEELSLCPYDLCLLDIHLPDYNGLELMKIIRHICPQTKVMIMSASYLDDNELSSNVKQALKNGACCFISKPFNLDEVKEIVYAALYNKDFQAKSPTNPTLTRQTRKFTRRPLIQQMGIAMTIYGHGSTRRWVSDAKTIDISEKGVGLVTTYPLEIHQVLSLKSGATEKTGIVVWSTMTKKNTCRAGIRFA